MKIKKQEEHRVPNYWKSGVLFVILITNIFSGGKIGYQVQISLENLSKVIRFSLGDICDMITEENGKGE